MSRLKAMLTPDVHLQVFVLESLFPPPHAFVLNSDLLTLLHLTMQPGTPHPVLLSEQQFTQQEMNLLLPLFTNFPEYAPMEELYTSFCYGCEGVNERRIEQAREHLNEALDEGVWDQELRGLRNVMSRTRFKLRHLGLDTVSLLETGYLLVGPTRRRTAGTGQAKEQQ